MSKLELSSSNYSGEAGFKISWRKTNNEGSIKASVYTTAFTTQALLFTFLIGVFY